MAKCPADSPPFPSALKAAKEGDESSGFAHKKGIRCPEAGQRPGRPSAFSSPDRVAERQAPPEWLAEIPIFPKVLCPHRPVSARERYSLPACPSWHVDCNHYGQKWCAPVRMRGWVRRDGHGCAR